MERPDPVVLALSPPGRNSKPKVVVTTAIAREMVGFIWAIARIAQPALEG